jgi:hypothetical protein
MAKKNKTLQQFLGAVVATAGLGASPLSADFQAPRGADVEPLAGNCQIGTFSQTGKAGIYNELCDVMQDSEKCLALIKGHFHYNGQTVSVQKTSEGQKAKHEYCLDVLKADLGLND